MVQPESRIAVSFVVTLVKDGVQSKESVKCYNLSSITLAAPLHHSFPHWTPPMVLLLFAASWCPLFFMLHVALVCDFAT
jgi:hypothetical protein